MAVRLLEALRAAQPLLPTGWHSVGTPAPPPDGEVNWIREPRFQVALAPGLPISWLTQDGVVERTLEAGDFLYLPGRCWQRVDRRRPRCFVGIVLFPTHVRYLYAERPGDGRRTPPQVWRHTQHPAPQIVSELLRRAEESPGRGGHAYLVATLHLLSEHLAADLQSHEGQGAHLFKAICAYIDENLASPLDRSTVAAAFERHPSTISQLFSRLGTESFHAYLTARRLERAATLLQETRLSVKQVGGAVGYGRPSHFGALFRRHYGLTPLAYRLQQAAGVA